MILMILQGMEGFIDKELVEETNMTNVRKGP